MNSTDLPSESSGGKSSPGPNATSQPSSIFRIRQALEALRVLEQLRVEGQRPPGVFLLEPLPYNSPRIDLGFELGFFAMEAPLEVSDYVKPLSGLQVWLYAAAQGNDWTRIFGPAVMAVEPEGLYVLWRGMTKTDEAQVVVRNRHLDAASRCLHAVLFARYQFDLYAGLRLERVSKDIEAGAAQRNIEWLNTELQGQVVPKPLPRRARPKLAAPKPTPAAAPVVDNRPWWEREDE